MILDTAALTNRDRYQLLTSLVVPRPIAWISTHTRDGRANLAPYSYFAALSATPFLIGVSIGSRRGEPKDTLRNIRDTGAFCVNVVTEPQMTAMNESAGEYPPEVDEFARAGLVPARAEAVDAPYVSDCPVVLECRLFKEVPLEGSVNTLVIGEVVRVRLADELRFAPERMDVETDSLRPVGRLWGDLYALIGEMPSLPRPKV